MSVTLLAQLKVEIVCSHRQIQKLVALLKTCLNRIDELEYQNQQLKERLVLLALDKIGRGEEQ